MYFVMWLVLMGYELILVEVYEWLDFLNWNGFLDKVFGWDYVKMNGFWCIGWCDWLVV